MLGHHAQRALESAAAKALERIRSDQRKAGSRLRPLLEHIEANLFDPGLDVNQLKRSCGVRDNSVPIQFHAQLGMPPHAYIEEARLSTGCRLLEESDLKIWQIADLLGYSSIQVFSRAFTRWAGVRPTSYRRQSRRSRNGANGRAVHAARPAARVARKRARSEAPAEMLAFPLAGRAEADALRLDATVAAEPLDARLLEVDNLRRALEGELRADVADKLIRRLLNLYPANALLMDGGPAAGALPRESVSLPSAARAPVHYQPATALLAPEEAERVRAEVLWAELKTKSAEERRQAIRQVPSRTPALFHYLCERSRVDGRDNRRFGVEVAELAIEALEGVGASPTESNALRAQGFAWLANAWRLAEDYNRCERILREASALLPADEVAAPEAWSVVLQNEAALHWNRRQNAQALERIDRAIVLLDGLAATESWARALLLKGDLLKRLDRPRDAIAELLKAAAAVPPETDPFFAYSAYQGAAVALVELGDVRGAKRFLPEAKRLAERLEKRVFTSLLVWVDGLIDREEGCYLEANLKLREARQGFVELEELSRAGLVSLDLAMLDLHHGHVDTAASFAGQAIQLLEATDIRGEALLAVGVLRACIERESLTTTALLSLRSTVVGLH